MVMSVGQNVTTSNEDMGAKLGEGTWENDLRQKTSIFLFLFLFFIFFVIVTHGVIAYKT